MSEKKLFDVLLSVQGAGWLNAYYWVMTVRSISEARAKVKARHLVARTHNRKGWKYTFIVALNAGPCGSFDQFDGKYVGQFIDEALCQD